jgi:glycosyltransferase involved in cell wall biosynthesis
MRFADPEVLKLYFQVDEDQRFHPEIAAATANIAMAINSEILDIISPHNPFCHLIPHSFQGDLSPVAKEILAGNYHYSRPEGELCFMYIGNLDHGFLNIDLFEKLVSTHPKFRFRLVGPYDPKKNLYQRLKIFQHVEFVGRIPSYEIPQMLDRADALILLYGKGFNFSSHKILEYLSSGKAIISTYMHEYLGKESLLYMSQTDEEYLEQFSRVTGNIEYFNSHALMESRIRFALDHTYSQQIERLEKYINEWYSKAFQSVNVV